MLLTARQEKSPFMKIESTLILFITSLFINNVYAITSDASDCNKALERGDFAAASSFAAKALNANKQDRDALICHGRVLSTKADLQGALVSFKAADELSKDAFDRTVIALVTGHAYKAAKEFDRAIASYQLAIEQAKKANHKGFERMSRVAIGNILFLGKQYSQSLEHYIAASLLDGNDNERGESNEQIALNYHKLSQHDLALEYQIKAFFMHEKSGTLDQFAHSSIVLGRYYGQLKNYAKAESTLNKIIKFAKEQGGAYYEAQGSYVLAQVKVAMGDATAAKALVEHAKAIAKNTNDTALDEEIEQETQGLFK